MSPPPAFRFIGVVIGGWVGLRLLAWMPSWVTADAAERHGQISAAAQGLPPPYAPADDVTTPTGSADAATQADPWLERFSPIGSAKASARPAPVTSPAALPVQHSAGKGEDQTPMPAAAAPAIRTAAARPQVLAAQAGPIALQPIASLPGAAPAQSSRWAASTWLFVRDGSGGALLPGGSLGGSQAGARVTYRVNGDSRHPLAISARTYAALRQPHGAEVALGIDWQPLARVPVHLLAERRERLGRSGRSDWQLTAYGGFDGRRGRLHVEGYGQAGVVGTGHPVLFADGAVRAGISAGPVEIGGGAWGGAQPGAARLDVGPRAGARLRIGHIQVRAEADWRFRVAGGAAPGSGPALTLSAGF